MVRIAYLILAHDRPAHLERLVQRLTAPGVAFFVHIDAKADQDAFASLAFAASFGIGVMASAVSIGVFQGLLTLLGVLLGSFVPEAHLVALTATGGLILVGVALRLLELKTIPVADLLPALLVAPLLVQIAGSFN